MICRLCLKDITEVINIFDEIGTELNVAAVLAKHFWFEPRSDDPISTAICNSCWISVSNFNEFYLGVEEAHRLLTERFLLKSDAEPRGRKQHSYSVSDEKVVDGWLQTSLSTTLSKPESGGEKEKIVDDSFENPNQNKSTTDEENHEEPKLLKNELLWNDDERSIYSESFIEDVMGLVEESEDALALPPEKKLRVTRSNTKKNFEHNKSSSNIDAPINPDDEKTVEAENSIGNKKRRGRPPKLRSEATDDESSKKEKSKSKRNSNEGDDSQQESYEERMRQIDEKIAQCIRLTCDICASEQPTFSQLRKHMEKMHQCKGYATCCNKKFNKRALLVGHIEKHINPDCYRCESCDKTFADKQCMRNHFLIKHQPEEEKQYQCEHCPKRFARPYILEQHRLIHEERKHICEVCNRGFASYNWLGTHMKTMHSGYGATMCDVCAKVIRGRTAFARHQLEHSGIVLPKVQCDKCGSWHKDKYSLQKHKRRHNDDGTVHVCSICGKVAPNRSALLSHQRYVHKSARAFECSVCKKAFKKAITLKEHMTMHTGEVLYSCPHCPKTFNSNANMHSHRKKMHPKEFEETRKQRRENAAKPVIPADGKEDATDSKTEEKQYKSKIDNNSDDSLPQVILIKSDDGRETHNILVTTEEGFSDNDEDGNTNENSIVFTIN
ncbi:transcription factor grauzone [Anastrepha obliqua]|uniref:transcription factor grauzone n=1 Tax=Anastrepha obliqua TaxID=95512 RepID=UPI0024098B86|nr:transcription factor grauzone [Anastrepha obliqua]